MSFFHNINASYWKILTLVLLFICWSALPSVGQKKAKTKSPAVSACQIGQVKFKCPDGFKKEQDIDAETILLKKDYEDSITYFFVSLPTKEFDDRKVKEAIGNKFSEKKEEGFVWKNVEEPLVMSLDTKYEKKIIANLGFNKVKLLNFVSRYFEFNGKIIVLGYVYDLDSDGIAGKVLFERGQAIGDSAIGCNAIATTLNTFTKEKKGNLQYCSLSALGAN